MHQHQQQQQQQQQQHQQHQQYCRTFVQTAAVLIHAKVNVTTLRKSLERIMSAIVVIDGHVLTFMISHVTTVMIGHVTTVMVQTRTAEGGSSTLMEITAVTDKTMPCR